MTTFWMTATPRAAPLLRLGGLMGPALARLARDLAARAMAWATVEDLRYLSDDQLRDIGIERDQLRAVARRAADGLHGLR